MEASGGIGREVEDTEWRPGKDWQRGVEDTEWRPLEGLAERGCSGGGRCVAGGWRCCGGWRACGRRCCGGWDAAEVGLSVRLVGGVAEAGGGGSGDWSVAEVVDVAEVGGVVMEGRD
ncbi:unnamed protein product [Staurois parvus]|uniref:Uncharacterized protein n=1 Tax=Staurois parvus TaxID=386267 RepID=A0ABN9C729_9NEOB|nr:unnamed protein product [Staurois parvus]